MDTLIKISPPLLIAFFVWAAVALVRRSKERRAAWESGLTARARVVRAWITTQVVNNVPRPVHWHEYDFTTPDGRPVLFKESGGPRGREVGDEVVVYYAADEPEKATASEPAPGRDAAATTIGLVFLGAGALIMLYVWANFA